MTAHRLIRTAGVFACVAGTAAIGLLGCDKSPAKPSSDATRPVLTNLSVTVTMTATTLGQTIQLTATAAFSDKPRGMPQARHSGRRVDPSVATVSPAGLVTIPQVWRLQHFGKVSIVDHDPTDQCHPASSW